jgi:septum formation protein
LASESPARLRLLRAHGFDPEVIVSGIDEDDVDGSLDTAGRVLELATRKAGAVRDRVEGALVLGCDSLLDLDGIALGKPATADDAVARWHAMRGRKGTLMTGHCVIDTATGAAAAGVSCAVIRFGTPTDAEIDAYVATGEPARVAGAFTIDGYGAAFVESIDGDPGGVIGVSLPLLRALLAQVGVQMVDLWQR